MSEKTETVGCRRWIESENNCCFERAAYIVWGKLFKPEHLGPRCKSCFLIEHPEIQIYRLDQYAVYKLPPANQEPQVQPDRLEAAQKRAREAERAELEAHGRGDRAEALAAHFREALSHVNGHIGIDPSDPTLREIRREVEEAYALADRLAPLQVQPDGQNGAIRHASDGGEPDLLAGMRPASAAHVNLTAAVLRCLEAGVEPETVRRFVDEELPDGGERGYGELAVEYLARRLYERGTWDGGRTDWSDLSEGRQNDYRYEARCHLEALAALPAQQVQPDGGEKPEHDLESRSDEDRSAANRHPRPGQPDRAGRSGSADPDLHGSDDGPSGALPESSAGAGSDAPPDRSQPDSLTDNLSQPDGGEREALRQELLSRGAAEAICQEVSGLSPSIREDVEDVQRALARILAPAPTVTAVPEAGYAVVGPPGLTSWSLEPPPDQPSEEGEADGGPLTDRERRWSHAAAEDRRRAERAESALEPFAEFGRNNTDENGWQEGACKSDRVVDWFGPSDFRAAVLALSDQPTHKETGGE